MDPSPEPYSDQTDEIKDLILMDTYTFISALVLFATFLIVVTQFRLWHRNKFLKMIPEITSHPVYSLINQSIGYAAAYENQQDLYLIWVVILLIAHENVYTIASHSLLERASYRWAREFSFLYNCIFVGVLITKYNKNNKFYTPLLALLLLVIAKFLIRIVSYVFAERAYGTENVNLVAEYMKSEHESILPSDAIDPTCMKGYKYLVMGEEKLKPIITAPNYSPKVKLTDDVVTVDRVWSCKKGLLHPSVDKDGDIKDVCLSFALFKLLRRRNFGYPAAEAEQPKTKELIFTGLLSENDKERVFRVIKMEIGFLRDLIFTRYPVGFAFGFPVSNLVLLGGMIGITLWLAIKAFILKNDFIFLTVKNHNVDYPLTNLLLILLILMDIFELLTYVFCDWSRVVMICQNVKNNSSLDTNEGGSSDANSQEAQHPEFLYKVLAFLCKPRISLSANNTLGQYSLLTNCHKTCVPWYYVMSTCVPCHKMEVRPPGVKRCKAVPLTAEVKKAIFDALLASNGPDGVRLTKGEDALRRNGVNVLDRLKWTVQDFATLAHTIMVWHVATSLCAIPLVNVEESIRPNYEVATYLSNYCAYLVAFHPELLPLTSNLVKYMLWEIVKETSEFFGNTRNLEEKYEKLMKFDFEGGDHTIIHLGEKLRRELTDLFPDDDFRRWKLMADFWSELILYVAPSGSTSAHMQQLSNGSEFITHLWALLYHAGIMDTTFDEYYP